MAKFYQNIISETKEKDIPVVVHGREINLFQEISITLLSHFSTKETLIDERIETTGL